MTSLSLTPCLCFPFTNSLSACVSLSLTPCICFFESLIDDTFFFCTPIALCELCSHQHTVTIRLPCDLNARHTPLCMHACASAASRFYEVFIVHLDSTTFRRSCTSALPFGTTFCSTRWVGSTTIALLSSMLTRWRFSRRRCHFDYRTHWGPHQCVSLRTFAPPPPPLPPPRVRQSD
jgi:hypothetical protein